MDPVWREKIPIRSYHVGNNGVLKPHVLFQFFQEAAGHHATHLTVGHEELQRRGVFWVLSRIKLEIANLPSWGDEIAITTWPKGTDRLFALRDFRMHGKDGTELVRGTSYWLLVSTERMRPQRLEAHLPAFPLNDKEHAIQESLERIEMPTALSFRYERQVMWGDLDVNNHVNNAEYVRWIADAIQNADGTIPEFSSLQVNYLEEAKLGENIVFSSGPDPKDPRTLYVEGVNKTKNSKIVQAKLSS